MTTVKGLSKSVTPVKRGMLGESPREISEDLKKLIKEETKIVKGRFKNYETPGGELPFKSGKYPGQPIFSQTFQDGGVYEVPLWVARHFNGKDVTARERNGDIGSCSYVVHGFKWDAGKPAPESQIGEGGIPIANTSTEKRIRRYGFESLEFNSEAV